MATTRIEVETPSGPGWIDLDRPARTARAVLALGHGAGGGVTAPDLVAVRDAALGAGFAVARITQPYRVAGRRAPAPAPRLDEAWIAIVEHLRRQRSLASVALIQGGRSSGARVACRTAGALGAAAVVALAFPLHPPGNPARTRIEELVLPTVPVLVVQGDRDAFGMPPASAAARLVVIDGADHSLKRSTAQIGRAVVEFVDSVLAAPPAPNA
ncbi:MAG TPA: alpha/beta family hydrolase [Jatrophihabitantaceae bacterium]|nr:alpha/beta family hydrolase [Jatrophihabitantaceae bacterium]